MCPGMHSERTGEAAGRGTRGCAKIVRTTPKSSQWCGVNMSGGPEPSAVARTAFVSVTA
jgi:hypothetical protein